MSTEPAAVLIHNRIAGEEDDEGQRVSSPREDFHLRARAAQTLSPHDKGWPPAAAPHYKPAGSLCTAERSPSRPRQTSPFP